jgi:primosomal protein N' (replication factor Y)
MDPLFPNATELDEAAARAGPTRYVRVAIERGVDFTGGAGGGTGDGFTYVAGADVQVGQQVEVPLGRNNKRAAGIVVVVGGDELLDGLAASKVKRILRASPSRLPASLVELARWMAGYYVCPLGMVLATMMPAAVKRGVGLATRVELEQLTASEAAVVLEREKVSAAVRRAWEAVAALELEGPASARELARLIGSRTVAPINRLVKLGLLKPRERRVVTARAALDLVHDRVEVVAATPELTSRQREAADGISAALGSFSVHLLRGVTGSGKTEVYMSALHRAIERGLRGLVLVPEISLTPQTAGRFIERFGGSGPVAVLHSGLSAAERHRQWALAAGGRAAVVVGARSAVFAPMERLGLIIVDEEHASDYKQDQLPRYSGRDVAIKRGQIEGCPVVLGSATPSLESFSNAIEGRYRLFELPDRVGGARLPRVEIVDLAQERRELVALGLVDPRHLSPLSRRLESALQRTLDEGGQAILLLNRRGYSSYVCCPSAACGWVMKCDDCDASMVLHRARVEAGELVRCHHCLAEQKVPRQCPVCARRVITLGAGTQRLEEDLAAKFPALVPGRTLVRVDGDTMRGAKDYFEVLGRFGAGEVRVLLGTQMIAKGLDYPNVRLVGVVNADTALSIPDFRAAERTFQLVSQVAGRCGRGMHEGLVIVQTVNPEEPAIALAARHDYVGFATRELGLRKRSGLPPATRVARIVVRDLDHGAARARAEELAGLLESVMSPGSRLLGPAPCAVSRVAGQFRFGLELIAAKATDLHGALARLRGAGLLKSDATTAVDVDPMALM